MKKQLDFEYYKELLINLLIGGLFLGLVFAAVKQNAFMGGLAFLSFVVLGSIVFPLYERFRTNQENITKQINKKSYRDVLKSILIGGLILGLGWGVMEQSISIGVVGFIYFVVVSSIIFSIYKIWREKQEKG